MALEQTQKVRYEVNERLDLNDKLAEGTLRDSTEAENRKQLVVGEDDGRVFRGFTTPVVTGANLGWSFNSVESVAVDRNGNVLLATGAVVSALTDSLATNTINYIHVYHDEDESDSATRRVYTGSAEVSQVINTRFTRTVKLYRTTVAYGAGTPDFADFSATALIGGINRQLIPLYGIAVNAGDSITAVTDFRPLWSVDSGGEYSSTSNPDLPHDFTPTDTNTLSMTDIRSSFVAIIDRLKQLKGTTNWWDDSSQTLESVATEWTISGANVYRPTGNVGVGMDPTAYKFQVKGDVYFEGASVTKGLIFEPFNDNAWVGTVLGNAGGASVLKGVSEGGVVVQMEANAATDAFGVVVDSALGQGTPDRLLFRVQADGDVNVYKDLIVDTGILNVRNDTDTLHYIGRAAIGYIGVADEAGFAHLDHATAASSAFRQGATGSTTVNAVSGGNVTFKINNITRWTLQSDGDLAAASGIQLLIDDGAVGAPGLGINGNANTGVYSPSTNVLAIAANGVEKMRTATNGAIFGVDSSGANYAYIGHDGSSAFIDYEGAGSLQLKVSDIVKWSLNTAGALIPTSGSVLQIEDGTLASAPSLAIRNSTTSGIYSPAADTFAVTTAGTEAFRVDASQRVGVGRTPTTNPLEVDSNLSVHGNWILTLASNDVSYSRDGINYLSASDASGSIMVRTGGGTNRWQFANTGHFIVQASTYQIRAGVGTAALPGISFSGNTTTGLSCATANTLVASANGAEGLRIDTSQRVGVNGRVPTSEPFEVPTSMKVVADDTAIAYLETYDTVSGVNADLRFRKSRGTESSPTAISTGDNLGAIRWYGNVASGTPNWQQAGYILCESDGVSGVGDMPGRMIFAVSPDGSSVPVTRWRLDEDGQTTFTSATSSTDDFLINANQDGILAAIGRARLGSGVSSDVAAFSHYDHTADAALEQNASGATTIKSASGQAISFASNSGGVDWSVSSDGHLGASPGLQLRFDDGTVGAPGIAVSGDTNTGIRAPAGDTLSLVTAGSDRVYVDSTGKVGFGVVPDKSIHLQSTTAVIYIDANTSIASISQTMPGLELTCSSMSTPPNYTPAIKFGSTDGQFTTTNPKFLAMIIGRNTEVYGSDTDSGMALDFATTANNVGASPTPTVRWSVDNNGHLAAQGTYQIRLDDGSVSLPGLSFGNDVDSGIYRVSANTIGIATNGVQRINIAATTGAVGIGTTSTTYRFYATVADGNNYVARFSNTGDSYTRWGMLIQCGGTPGTGNALFIDFLDGGGSDAGGIYRVNSATPSFRAPSDARIKTDIAPTRVNALDTLCHLPLKEFRKFKATVSSKIVYPQPELQPIGWVAQDVENVLPSMVSESETDGTKSVSDTNLIPYLVKAVQELTAELTEAQNRIRMLETKV